MRSLEASFSNEELLKTFDSFLIWLFDNWVVWEWKLLKNHKTAQEHSLRVEARF